MRQRDLLHWIPGRAVARLARNDELRGREEGCWNRHSIPALEPLRNGEVFRAQEIGIKKTARVAMASIEFAQTFM